MKYLLDTHILIWFFKGNEKLSAKASKIIEDAHNEIYCSSVSVYEIDLKRAKHADKISTTGKEMLALCRKAGFEFLPFTENHAIALENLHRPKNAPPHNDPFDRMLICQAIAENMLFMTHDERIAEYDTPNIFKV